MLIVICILLVVLMTPACGPVDTTSTPPPLPLQQTTEPVDENEEPAYPPPQTADNSGYPVPPVSTSQVAEAYPAPENLDIDPNIPRFQFDEPLSGDVATVTGKAPPGLSLLIVDITFGGVILGSGQSDDQGNFSISVAPLPQGHRVGVTFTDPEDGKSMEQKAEELFPYRGDEFMNVPNIGIFFETTMVQP